jgi:hypothetical protein
MPLLREGFTREMWGHVHVIQVRDTPTRKPLLREGYTREMWGTRPRDPSEGYTHENATSARGIHPRDVGTRPRDPSGGYTHENASSARGIRPRDVGDTPTSRMRWTCPREMHQLPGPSNLCLFSLVLVWQSRELGHELVVIILREADMKCLKLLLINVDHTCALQEVVGAGGQLIWCRLGGRHKAGQASRRERPFVLHRRLVQPRGCRLEAQAPIAWNGGRGAPTKQQGEQDPVWGLSRP